MRRYSRAIVARRVQRVEARTRGCPSGGHDAPVITSALAGAGTISELGYTALGLAEGMMEVVTGFFSLRFYVFFPSSPLVQTSCPF